MLDNAPLTSVGVSATRLISAYEVAGFGLEWLLKVRREVRRVNLEFYMYRKPYTRIAFLW